MWKKSSWNLASGHIIDEDDSGSWQCKLGWKDTDGHRPILEWRPSVNGEGGLYIHMHDGQTSLRVDVADGSAPGPGDRTGCVEWAEEVVSGLARAFRLVKAPLGSSAVHEDSRQSTEMRDCWKVVAESLRSNLFGSPAPRRERGWKVLRRHPDNRLWSCSPGKRVEYIPGKPTKPDAGCGPLTVFPTRGQAADFAGMNVDDAGPTVTGLVVRPCSFVRSCQGLVWTSDGCRVSLCDMPRGTILADEVIIDPEEPRLGDGLKRGWKVLRRFDGKLVSSCMCFADKVEYVPGQPTRPKAGCGPLTVFADLKAAEAFSSTKTRGMPSEDGLETIWPCSYVPSKRGATWKRGKMPVPLGELASETELADEVTLDAEIKAAAPPSEADPPTSQRRRGWKVVRKNDDGSLVSALGAGLPSGRLLGKGTVQYVPGKPTRPKQGFGPLCVFPIIQRAEEFLPSCHDWRAVIRPCTYVPSAEKSVWECDADGLRHVVALEALFPGTRLADEVTLDAEGENPATLGGVQGG